MATYENPGHHSAGDAESGLRPLVSTLQKTLAAWSERARRRRELEEVLAMPDHLLRDMGVTREEVYRQCRKPFWRE